MIILLSLVPPLLGIVPVYAPGRVCTRVKSWDVSWYIQDMTITLNGSTERLDSDRLSVRGLLAAKSWSFPLIIVEVNGALVARDEWDAVRVADGDVVEATHLMSGG